MPELVGQSPAFLQMMESIRQVAPTQITVLITGESGTGKEMVARTIHHLSPRNGNALITVNCGAIPEGILESELFGHEKGAFTGATDARKGYFELAHQGTIFLDEIGEMPLATQVKLLRVLESRSFMRVGGSRSIEVDARVLAATNKNLELAVQQGDFRKDLFFRLNAVHIPVPPLRERKEDIRLFVRYFTGDICERNRIPEPAWTEEALDFLVHYHWPGNIRELRNVVERLIVLERGRPVDAELVQKHMPDGETERLPMVIQHTNEQTERELIYRALLDIRVALEDLRRLMVGYHERHLGQSAWVAGSHEIVHEKPVNEQETLLTIQELEKQQMEKALELYKNNRRQAAKALGIGERTLYRKLKEYGLD
ncbi:sigma-54-dependent Fis family transcriptional regulator [bacterium]|nr:sigma-54-dependent Fis family transcriptional regulator [bacterium]